MPTKEPLFYPIELDKLEMNKAYDLEVIHARLTEIGVVKYDLITFRMLIREYEKALLGFKVSEDGTTLTRVKRGDYFRDVFKGREE